MQILIANSIASSLRSNLEQSFASEIQGSASIGRFPSTEAFTEILDDVQGKSVVVVQSGAAANDHTANDYAMQLLLTVRTLKRYGAEAVWVVAPFAPFARQDKSRKGHFDSIAADDFAALLKSAGADGFSTMEIHSETALNQIRNHFGVERTYNIDPVELLAAAVPQQEGVGIVVGGPDGSADARAQKLASILDAETFQTQKHRSDIRVSETELTQFNGQVAGKHVVMIDDMIDTGGTVLNCANRAVSEGAGDITVCTAHFIGSNGALEKLMTERRANGGRLITQLIITDSIDRSKEIEQLERKIPGISKRISVHSAAGLLTQHIRRDIAPRFTITP